MRHRWLPRFPNYDRALSICEVTPDITEADFVDRFVMRHQPCVVRGGAKHWPATRNWNIDSLRNCAGDVSVGRYAPGFSLEPIPEYGANIFWAKPGKLTLSKFLDYVVSDEHPYVQLYSEHVASFEALSSDLGRFEFLDLARYPARFYSDRIFFSRSGYTDWHAHSGDESLTAQVCSTKEILMLAPDQATWDAIHPLARSGVWRVPYVYWPPEFAMLVPWRVLLEPGDVVYIPMHWWHAAESVNDDLNITVARVFGTPLRWLADLRLPNARFSVKALLRVALSRAVLGRDLVQLVEATHLAALTLGGFPLALARNRGPTTGATPTKNRDADGGNG